MDGYKLLLQFENKEEKIFDVTLIKHKIEPLSYLQFVHVCKATAAQFYLLTAPYLNRGKFSELKEVSLFNSVSICFDSIEWAKHLDLYPELLYQQSIPV